MDLILQPPKAKVTLGASTQGETLVLVLSDRDGVGGRSITLDRQEMEMLANFLRPFATTELYGER